MVLPPEPRGPESDVLPLRVRQQEQLQPADKPGVLRESGSLELLQIHRQIHSDGKQNKHRFFAT